MRCLENVFYFLFDVISGMELLCCFDIWARKTGGLIFYMGCCVVLMNLLSTNGLRWWHHLPRHHHFPHHCHVSKNINLHVIIAIHVIAKSTATSSYMSSIYDVAIEFVTKFILFVIFIFVIENGLGLGFRGPGTFHDGFKTSWIKQSMTKI